MAASDDFVEATAGLPRGLRVAAALAPLLAKDPALARAMDSLAVVGRHVLIAAYAHSFSVDFIFDDSYGIAQNPALRSLKEIPRYFADPFLLTPVRENVDLRPVLMVTFALNYAISGLAPWSWHALNLLLH